MAAVNSNEAIDSRLYPLQDAGSVVFSQKSGLGKTSHGEAAAAGRGELCTVREPASQVDVSRSIESDIGAFVQSRAAYLDYPSTFFRQEDISIAQRGQDFSTDSDRVGKIAGHEPLSGRICFVGSAVIGSCAPDAAGRVQPHLSLSHCSGDEKKEQESTTGDATDREIHGGPPFRSQVGGRLL